MVNARRRSAARVQWSCGLSARAYKVDAVVYLCRKELVRLAGSPVVREVQRHGAAYATTGCCFGGCCVIVAALSGPPG